MISAGEVRPISRSAEGADGTSWVVPSALRTSAAWLLPVPFDRAARRPVPPRLADAALCAMKHGEVGQWEQSLGGNDQC